MLVFVSAVVLGLVSVLSLSGISCLVSCGFVFDFDFDFDFVLSLYYLRKFFGLAFFLVFDVDLVFDLICPRLSI